MLVKVTVVSAVVLAASLAVLAQSGADKACFETCFADYRTGQTQAETSFTKALEFVTTDVRSCLADAADAPASFVCLRQGRARTVTLENDFRQAMAQVSTDLNACAKSCAPQARLEIDPPTP